MTTHEYIIGKETANITTLHRFVYACPKCFTAYFLDSMEAHFCRKCRKDFIVRQDASTGSKLPFAKASFCHKCKTIIYNPDRTAVVCQICKQTVHHRDIRMILS